MMSILEALYHLAQIPEGQRPRVLSLTMQDAHMSAQVNRLISMGAIKQDGTLTSVGREAVMTMERVNHEL